MTDFLNKIKAEQDRLGSIRGPGSKQEDFRFFRPASGFGDYIDGFTSSAVDSVGELIGIDPQPATEKFRNEHPIGGFVSSFAIPVGGYAGFYSATKRIKGFNKLINKLGNIETAPLRTGFVREAVRFAPVETARVAGSAAFGEDTDEVLSSALFNIAFSGLVGGSVEKLKRAGDRISRLREMSPDLDLRAPAQFQLQSLTRSLKEKTIPEQHINEAKLVINRLKRHIREEEVAAGESHIRQLMDGAKAGKINRLMSLSSGKNLKRRKIAIGPNGFRSSKVLQDTVNRIGLPSEWEAFSQFPRHLKTNSPDISKAIGKTLDNEFKGVGGWRFAQEADDGLYVMAKQVKGNPAKPAAGDEFFVVKTNSPGKFVPDHAKFADKVVSRNDKLFKPIPAGPSGVETVDFVQGFVESVSWLDYRALKGDGKALLSRLGLNKISGPAKVHADALGSFITKYFTPTAFQFRNHPRANYILGVTRATMDRAQAKANAILFGKASLGKGESLFKGVIGNVDRKGGLLPLFDDASQTDLDGVFEVWLRGWDDAAAEAATVRGDITPAALELTKQMRKVDDEAVEEMVALNKLVGRSDFTPKANHLGLTRGWVGTRRVEILDDQGRRIAVASGVDNAAAQKEADFIIQAARETDERVWTKGQEFTAGKLDDLELVRTLPIQSNEFRMANSFRLRFIKDKTNTPGFFREQTGVEGFVGSKLTGSVKKEDLKNILKSHVSGIQRYLADQTLLANPTLRRQYLQQMDENADVAQQLQGRLNDFRGIPGEITKQVDDIVDPVLGKVFGSGSASEIIRVANRTMFNYMLGVGNTAFLALNALTFMQTGFPQMAFAVAGSATNKAKYYQTLMTSGADGRVKGSISVLDSVKMVAESFKKMRKPDAQLTAHFNRALNDGVVDPRFVEEFVGQNAARISRVKETLKNGEYGKFLVNASEFGPGVSEKFSRGQSFTLAHNLGRDFLGLEDDALYQFAKQFTTNSMFLYSTADRARLITGPFGTLFGLFKNWQMHYISWMMTYADEFSRGNFKPLLWQMGGTAMVGGVGGLPFVPSIADGAAQWLGDESAVETIYRNFGGPEGSPVADAIYYGLPAFAGVSMQASAAAPFADPSRDASMLFNFVHWDRMKAVGRAVGTAIDTAQTTGEHPIKSGGVRDQFVRALAPKTFYRAAQTMEEEGIKSLNTGYLQNKDLGLGAQVAFSLGFNPIQVEREYTAGDLLWNDQQALRSEIQNFGRAIAEAIDEGDFDASTRLTRRAMLRKLPMDSVAKSVQTRLAKGREDMITRQFDAAKTLERKKIGLIQ